MNAHPIFLSFLSLSPVNSLPSFSSPFLHYPLLFFCRSLSRPHSHPEPYSLFLFISVSSLLHCGTFFCPAGIFHHPPVSFSHTLYMKNPKKQSAAFQPQSYSISLTPSRTSPCFSLRVQRMCKNTFSTTDLERILAWWDPHKPDLSKLTLYTEFTALVNQHFNLWLYIFSLAS